VCRQPPGSRADPRQCADAVRRAAADDPDFPDIPPDAAIEAYETWRGLSAPPTHRERTKRTMAWIHETGAERGIDPQCSPFRPNDADADADTDGGSERHRKKSRTPVRRFTQSE
jgi:hypothetical protein